MFGGFVDIVFDLFASVFRYEFFNQRMFGRESDERNAEKRVRAGGEYFESIALFGSEEYFAAVGFAYPVLLHKFGLFGPVEFVEFIQKFFGVVGYFEEPLRKVAFYDLRSATFAFTAFDLFVREYGVATRTPVYGRLFAICETFFVEFEKEPLRPLVIVGHTGFYFGVPVEHRAHGFKLFFHRGDVREGRLFRMNARFYGVVFGGQAERVEPHRLEHFVSLHLFIPCETVGQTVIVPMPEMQFRRRRIGKHFKTIELFVYILLVERI